eukprot:jgi/Botrbrau1/15224/Bobra.0149s0079.1
MHTAHLQCVNVVFQILVIVVLARGSADHAAKAGPDDHTAPCDPTSRMVFIVCADEIKVSSAQFKSVESTRDVSTATKSNVDPTENKVSRSVIQYWRLYCSLVFIKH